MLARTSGGPPRDRDRKIAHLVRGGLCDGAPGRSWDRLTGGDSGVFPSLATFMGDLRTTPLSASDRAFLVVFFLGLIAFYGVFAVTNYAGAGGVFDNEGLLIGRDFVVFWTASVLSLAGEVSKVFDFSQFHAMQEELMGTTVPIYAWLYPPVGLFAILPLGLLPYLWAYTLWSAITLALYLLASLGRPWASLETAGLVLAPATFVSIVAGQNGLLSAALLVGGLRLLDKYPALAGVLFGLLCFKPHLGLLVPVALLAARLWRPFLSAAVTVAAVIGLSVAVFGLESWLAYFDASTAFQGMVLNAQKGWLLNIVVTPFMGARLLGLGLAASISVHAVFAVCAAVGVYAAFRQQTDRQIQAAVLLAAVFLASPYGYTYDLPLVSVAALWAYGQATKTGFLPGERLLLALVWMLPLLALVGNLRGVPLAAPILALFFLVLLVRCRHRLGRRVEPDQRR